MPGTSRLRRLLRASWPLAIQADRYGVRRCLTLAEKARLEAQLAELEGRQNRITEALDEPLSPDASERATEMEDDQSLEGQALLITREIASLKRALTRIENGTYGECVRCGNQIAPKRLEARPEAALCFACASETIAIKDRFG